MKKENNMKSIVTITLIFVLVSCLILSINAKPKKSADSAKLKPGSSNTKFTSEQLKLPGKKGIGLCLRDPKSAKAKKVGGGWDKNIPLIKKLDLSWNYSWGANHISLQPKNIEFVPMTWGGSNKEELRQSLQKTVKANIKSQKSKRLLGFNEPDKKDQSDIPYMKAIELWPELEKLDIPLCSPACANTEGINDDTAQGVPGTWMKDFVKEADKRGYRIDYIGVHWYGGGSAPHFKEKLKRIYDKYGKRPLLITEFAPADWTTGGDIKQNKHKPEKVLKFMKEVLPWMEKQDWIAGYAWFPFNIDSPQGTSSALFDKKGNLTACGRYYKSVTPENPMGDQSIKADLPYSK
jgi:hypothetical protein